MKTTKDLRSIFSQLEDPRSHINKLHKLEDILLIGIISVICAADTWKNMETYARAKEGFLRTFLDLPYGIPSDDTFNRVFSSIDSEQFEQCFISWVRDLVDLTDGEVVPIDGKTIRGAKSKGKKSPFHMVSAWASTNNMVLGQVKVSEKSNEITAIPRLLEILTLKGCIVTIDAMGCQQDIADKIIDSDADYVLAVKENQKQLYQDIQDEFRFGKDIQTHLSEDLDHGRIETRKCSIIKDFKFIEDTNRWSELKTIIKIESTREFKNSDKPAETATRYYISSLIAKPEDFQKIIRSHWHIENKLHWTLDVAFSEDASRKRTGNAAQNFSVLMKIALNLLKNEKTEKQGIKGKRLRAAYDNQYLIKLLNLKV
jgi:predicted transposase YbfD/YdcC